MGKGKKGKKGKNKVPDGPQPVTTALMIQDRTRMLCPRMGDYYLQTVNVETILEDVSEKLLQKIIDQNLSTASLCNMKLSQFPKLTDDALHDLNCLTNLNLSKNNLFNGDDLFKAISQLGNLRKLNVSHNFLNGPLSDHVGNMSMLEEINLDVNNITSLCPEVQYWTSIRVVTMSDNSLVDLPIEAGSWKDIQLLNMKNNKIVDVGKLPKYWPNLNRLFLGSNLLTMVPFEIGDCKNLKVLDLSCNAIQNLPLSLQHCSNLEQLHLGSNKIETIPSEIVTSLVNLRELHLYKNKIQVLPPEIGSLQHLKKLTLSSNNLKGLPDEIGACTLLEELYVSNNAKFSYFPQAAGHLRKLKELSLSKNPALKQLPATIAEMTSLTELDIRGAKKQVCKITPEIVSALRDKSAICAIRGGVVKKGKGGKKK